MKYLLIASLGLFAFSSFGADDFATKKQKMTEHLDEKITHLQDAKSCVQVAADKDALKNCKREKQEEMKELKKDMNKYKEREEEKLNEESPVDFYDEDYSAEEE